MGSAVKSNTPESTKAMGTRVRLTAPGQPAQVRQGVWSKGPVYKQLDADFLQRPLIPKAPPAAKLTIDDTNGNLRVIDTLNQPAVTAVAEPVSMPQVGALRRPHRHELSRFKFHVIALLAGFAAGLAAALILGWL